MRVIADVPISEQLLSIILEAGSDPSVPIDAADTVDVIENLTKRASSCSNLMGLLFLFCYLEQINGRRFVFFAPSMQLASFLSPSTRSPPHPSNFM